VSVRERADLKALQTDTRAIGLAIIELVTLDFSDAIDTVEGTSI